MFLSFMFSCKIDSDLAFFNDKLCLSYNIYTFNKVLDVRS